MKASLSTASAYSLAFIWWLIVTSYVADPFLLYDRFVHAGDIAAIKTIRSWLSLYRTAAFLPFLICYPHAKDTSAQRNWLLHSIGIVALSMCLFPMSMQKWTKTFALDLLDCLGIISARAAAVYLGMLLLAISRRSAILIFHGFGYLDLLAFHKAAGWWCVATSLIHSLAYVVYYLVEGGLEDLWRSCFPTELCALQEGDCFNTLGLVNFLGVLATVPLIILAVHSREHIRRSMYERFYFLHLAMGAMFVFLVGLHDFPTMLLAFAGLAFYGRDRWTAWRSRTSCPAAKAEVVCTSPSSKIVLLTWESAAPQHLMPGSRWVYLCVENISTVQWHPVSVIRIRNRMHSFVKGLGDWSWSLCDLTASGVAVRIKTEGPFGKQACKPDTKSNGLLMIAGGVGISPFVDLLCNMPENAWWPKVVLVWAVRRQEYDALSAIVDLQSLSQVCDMSVFITSDDANAPAMQAGTCCAVTASPDNAHLPQTKEPYSRYRVMCSSCALVSALAWISEAFRKHVFVKYLRDQVDSLVGYTFALRVAPVSCAILLITFASFGLLIVDRLKSRVHKHGEDDMQIQLTTEDIPFHELSTPRHMRREHDPQVLLVNADTLVHRQPQMCFAKLDVHEVMQREAKLGPVDVQVCGPQRLSVSAMKAAHALNKQGLKCKLHVHESVM
eukprot:TRINITY_DN41478_c0_g1_i1.p1 TRINITY_DN41478_c0_g1~~TRINITY_DN41478_c0_g1_i1.p1  ORF type:complete len:669 (+),score=56.86 TRINITY_DN41478_c0_g1_i1:98-2104(+)